MFCQKCGTQLPPDTNSCPNCDQNKENVPQQYQDNLQKEPLTEPIAINIIKSAGRSTLFLVATILMTVAAALGAIVDSVDFLSILMLVGLWMFYSESKKVRGPYAMDIKGLKILRITKTISAVILWICAVIIAIVFALLFGLTFGAIPAEAAGVKGILGIILVVGLVIVSVFFAIEFILIYGIRKYYIEAIESANTGKRPKKLGKLAPTLLMIQGILSAISAISSAAFSSAFISFISSTANNYLYVLPSDYQSIYGDLLSSISLTVSPSIFISTMQALLTAAANIMFAYILLNFKEASDNAVYPDDNEENI